MSVMTTPDRYILKVERVVFGTGRRRFNSGDKLFCLGALLTASPTSPDSAYGKKMVMNYLLAQPGNMLTCPIEGCEVTVPKADLETQEGVCALASFCLKEAWDVRNNEDETSERLWENTIEASQQLQNAGNAGYRCPSPLCEFSAGWSIDACAGTHGDCDREKLITT